MNRYIFAVPFVMVAMAYYFQTKPWTTPINVIIAIVIGLLAISLGAMRPIEGFSDFTMGAGIVTIIGFFIWSLYVFLLSMLNHTQFRRRILPVLYVLNLMLQIYLFNVFMNGEWVG